MSAKNKVQKPSSVAFGRFSVSDKLGLGLELGILHRVSVRHKEGQEFSVAFGSFR